MIRQLNLPIVLFRRSIRCIIKLALYILFVDYTRAGDGDIDSDGIPQLHVCFIVRQLLSSSFVMNVSTHTQISMTAVLDQDSSL